MFKMGPDKSKREWTTCFNECKHGKNGFAEIPKNLARYRFNNNFVGPSKYVLNLTGFSFDSTVNQSNLDQHGFYAS